MLLSLDPSSTRAGYAVFNDQGRLVERGLIKPTRTRDPAHDRIDSMVKELVGIRDQYAGIDRVVIEDTDGKVGKRHRGGGAGLAIYGFAVRAFRDVARGLWGHDAVHMVLANTWTRGRRKSTRAAALGLTTEGDSGLDAADAVGLGEWFLANQSADSTGRRCSGAKNT